MFLSKEEFELVKNKNKAIVTNLFVGGHGVKYNQQFWDTPTKGKTPRQKLEEVALEECIHIKAEQMLSLQFGLEEDISYERFLHNFKEENKKRNKMILGGQVVYGPMQYTLEQYYAYTNSNRRTALCREILRRGMISEEEIIRFYNDFKDNLYKKPDTYKLLIDQVSKKAKQECAAEMEINPENIRLYAKQYPKLIQSLQVIQEGDCIELQDSKGQVYVIKCQKKITNGYFKQVEVKDDIKDRLVRSKRDDLVKKLIKEIGNGDQISVYQYENQGE